MTIDLSDAQIHDVLRQTAEEGSIVALFGTGAGGGLYARLAEHENHLRRFGEFAKRSRSLLQALLILSQLPQDGTSIGLGQLAAQVGISPSTVHRYLATWTMVGVTTHDPKTGQYARSGGLS